MRNLPELFISRANYYASQPALWFKKNGSYHSIAWLEWYSHVRRVALGLYALGIRKGDRVAILSENRPEWTFADLGILSLGAVTVPIYPTSTPSEIDYILKNAETETLFISDQNQTLKLSSFQASFSVLRSIISFSPVSGPQTEKLNWMSLERLEESGRCVELNNPDLYRQNLEKVHAEDLATLIYTSGTTGPPKGVMLTHENFIANCMGSAKYIDVTDRDLSLSFLPLSHVFERMAGYYFMIYRGAQIAYAESMQTVADDIQIVHPTVAAAVPRFYEKVYARLMETLSTLPPSKQRLFQWAVKVGKEFGEVKMSGQKPPFGLMFRKKLADLLVFKKIKAKLGGRIRFFISGGAPLSKELAEFFYSADVLILEGYGLTETSPVMTVNSDRGFRFGTVGKPLPNVDVKIARDGEILTKGPCVMKGYFKNEKATQEAIVDGWFHTGDIGDFTSEGFLRITDRKKDIIVTSGGKNVSPQNIENSLLADSLFSQIIVIGDKRNYLVALIVPNRAEILKASEGLGLAGMTYEAMLKDPRIYNYVDQHVQERTRQFAPYEQIKYFVLLDHELTQGDGELTPTLKIKRKYVTEKYRDLIEQLYQKGQPRQSVP